MKPTYEQLEAEVHALRAEVSELKAYILRLEEIIKQNSKNSSKPPSSDQKANLPPKVPKKRGPPFGHPFYQRALFSPEQVKERVVIKDLFCKECGSLTQVLEDAPLIHQQVEIPPSSFYVRQIERYYSYCPICHKKRVASFPKHENLTGFGTRLTSFVALCTGQYRLSKDQARALVQDAFGVKMCAGSVINLEQRVSSSLKPSYDVILKQLQTEKGVKHIDETSWRTEGENRYLWVLATAHAVAYKVQRGRGTTELKTLLNDQKKGTFVTDRYAVYRFNKHQLCLAHLLRDFQKYREREGPDGHWGEMMGSVVRSMISLWKEYRLGKWSQKTLVGKTQLDRELFHYWLVKGAISERYSPSLQRFAFSLHQRYSSLFRFIGASGVDPTNNHAERLLRHVVIWRKTSFGNRSAKGERFIERVCSVLKTLTLLGKEM